MVSSRRATQTSVRCREGRAIKNKTAPEPIRQQTNTTPPRLKNCENECKSPKPTPPAPQAALPTDLSLSAICLDWQICSQNEWKCATRGVCSRQTKLSSELGPCWIHSGGIDLAHVCPAEDLVSLAPVPCRAGGCSGLIGSSVAWGLAAAGLKHVLSCTLQEGWAVCGQHNGSNTCPGVAPNMLPPGPDRLGMERMGSNLSLKKVHPSGLQTDPF
jgi:hypothetical protein